MTSSTPVTVIGGVKEHNYHFVWKIQNFMLVQCNDQLLNKQRFQIETGEKNEHRAKWEAGLVTNPQTKKFTVSVKLHEGPENEVNIFTKIAVGLLRGDGLLSCKDVVHKTYSKDAQFPISRAFSYEQEESYWASSLDANGTATFTVDLSVLDMEDKGTMESKAASASKLALETFKKNSLSVLQQQLARLLKDGKDHDLKIVCSDDKVLEAHASILRARCPVFDTMLSSENEYEESQTKTITLNDITGKTMEIVLHFLYTGELQGAWKDQDTIVEFIYVAGKYQLTDVLQLIDCTLGNDDKDASLLLLNLTHKLSLKNAEAKLMERIVKLTNAAKSSTDLFALFDNVKTLPEPEPESP